MSGSIGASRILREQVRPTVDKYIQTILNEFPGYKQCEITGSYNVGIKKDHGDIDLCVWIDSENDIKLVKKEFQKYIESLSDAVTPPFIAGRNIGKKAQLYGSIVTCQVPIIGNETSNVQIDNIIVLSEEELNFQKSFLNLNAQLQTLYTALVRVTQDNLKQQAFNYFHIDNLPILKEHQEFEFVLSTAGFSLRKITLNDEYKQIAKEELWRSTNWNNVIWLINNILNIQVHNKSYEELLNITAKVFDTDERSRRRICGVMKSMINIGPGEIGTLKGEAKEQGIKLAYEKLHINFG